MPTLIKRAYDNIILTLADDDMYVDIPRRVIESLLAVEMGAIKPDTLERHISLMCDLGYLKLTSRGFGRASLKYDLVGKKLETMRKTAMKEVEGDE